MSRRAAGRGPSRDRRPRTSCRRRPAPVRPGTHPSPRAPARARAPWPAVPVLRQSRRLESRQTRRLRRFLGSRQGRIRAAGPHASWPSEAKPRASSPPSVPRARRGQAPRRSGGGSQLEPAFWLRHCPLPPGPLSEEHPRSLAPLPASSAVKGRLAAADRAEDRPPLVSG